MSFDIFLNCHIDGNVDSTFPRSILEEAFAPFIESREPGRWVLKDSLAEVWIGDGPEIGGFMVSRPPGDRDPPHPFWPALLSVMQRTHTVLYWPAVGKPACVVADASMIVHMPPDMLKVLGTPPVVTRPEEFWERISESDA